MAKMASATAAKFSFWVYSNSTSTGNVSLDIISDITLELFYAEDYLYAGTKLVGTTDVKLYTVDSHYYEIRGTQ